MDALLHFSTLRKSNLFGFLCFINVASSSFLSIFYYISLMFNSVGSLVKLSCLVNLKMFLNCLFFLLIFFQQLQACSRSACSSRSCAVVCCRDFLQRRPNPAVSDVKKRNKRFIQMFCFLQHTTRHSTNGIIYRPCNQPSSPSPSMCPPPLFESSPSSSKKKEKKMCLNQKCLTR